MREGGITRITAHGRGERGSWSGVEDHDGVENGDKRVTIQEAKMSPGKGTDGNHKDWQNKDI